MFLGFLYEASGLVASVGGCCPMFVLKGSSVYKFCLLVSGFKYNEF